MGFGLNQVVLLSFVLVAVTAVCFTVQIIGIVLVQKSITTAASGVAVMVAMATQRNIIIAIDILVPDAFPTAFAGGGVILQTVGADNLPVPLGVVIVINKAAAALTIQGFFGCFYFFTHLKFLRKMKIALPNGIGRALCFGFNILLLRAWWSGRCHQ